MASEPYTFVIESDVDFDGQTLFEATRNDFANAADSRLYTIHVDQAFGQISADFFGSLKGERPKMVGISGKFNNPFSVARVVPHDDPDGYRTELDLTPEMQYVPMYAGDKLAILTRDGGRTSVTLVVNEMAEAEHMRYAIAKPPALHWRRYRIVRNDPTGFKPGFNQNIWQPNFVFDRTHHVLTATEVASGPIPLGAFCTYPEFAGCLVRARFANIQDKGHMHVVEAVQRAHRSVGGVKNMIWSRVAALSHDDHISLQSGDAIANDTTICDLMIARVEAQSLLQGLYDRGK